MEPPAPGGTHPKPGWVWAASVIDGTGTGVVNAALSVLIATRFGIAAAGLTYGVTAFGRVGSFGLVRRFERRHRGPAGMSRAFAVTVTVMVVAAIGTLAAAAWGPYLAMLACSSVLSVTNNMTSVIVASEGRAHIVRLGPLAMAGQALGAVLAGAALAIGGAVAVAGLAVGVTVQWLQVPLMARWGFGPMHHEQIHWRALLGPATRALVLSACSYGPLAIYSALVVQTSSVAWIGPAMVAYGLGALSASWWDTHVSFARRWPALCLLAAAGVAPWIFAVSGPAVTVGRAVSGAALFLAQGRLFAQVAAEIPGPAGISAASTGLGLGAGLGAVLAGALAARYGVSGMGLVLTALTASVGVALSLWHARRPGHASPSP